MRAYLTVCLAFILVIFISSPIIGNEKVVVIPLLSSKGIKNVVTVGKAGADFCDPFRAVESILDASETNPYLVAIGPGEFYVTEPLQMKPYVSIIGSGREVTTISGNISSVEEPSPAIILGADNATLSDLTVENNGTSENSSAGVINENSSPTLRNLNIRVTNAVTLYGIVNRSSSPLIENLYIESESVDSSSSTGIMNELSSPRMSNIVIKISSQIGAIGVYNDTSNPIMENMDVECKDAIHVGTISNYSSSPTMTNITALAKGGSLSNYAIYIGDTSTPQGSILSEPVLRNVSARAESEEGANCGIRNTSSSNTTVIGVTAIGAGNSTYSQGLCNHSADISVHHSIFKGDTNGIYSRGTGSIKVIQSSLQGGFTLEDTAILTCVSSDNGLDKELESTCNEVTDSQ